MMMKKFWLLLVIMGIFSSLALAQDDAGKMSPLVNALSYVPDTPEGQAGEFQYLNLAAMKPAYEAFSGAPVSTPEDVMNMLLNRLFSAGDMFQYIRSDPEGITASTGVNPFEIQTVLVYGVPPTRGLVLTGGYTADAVNAAHAARDYVSETIGDFTLWCGDETCDGTKQNLREVDQTNLFDMPPLGRKPPVAVSETAILSSTDVEAVKAGIAAHAEGTNTLAQSPQFGVLANALTQDAPGELIQAYILPTALVLQNFPVITADTPDALLDAQVFGQLAPEVMTVMREEIADYGPLPAYSMLAFGDYFDGTNDVTVIALVYFDAEVAQSAADEVAKRLSTFSDAIARRGTAEETVLDSVSAGDVTTSVFTQEGSTIAVARITIAYPQPEEGSLRAPQTGRLYWRLMNSMFQRGVYPLWPVEAGQ